MAFFFNFNLTNLTQWYARIVGGREILIFNSWEIQMTECRNIARMRERRNNWAEQLTLDRRPPPWQGNCGPAMDDCRFLPAIVIMWTFCWKFYQYLTPRVIIIWNQTALWQDNCRQWKIAASLYIYILSIISVLISKFNLHVIRNRTSYTFVIKE